MSQLAGRRRTVAMRPACWPSADRCHEAGLLSPADRCHEAGLLSPADRCRQAGGQAADGSSLSDSRTCRSLVLATGWISLPLAGAGSAGPAH